MSAEVYNPVAIEHAIKACSDRISAGVRVCNERYVAYLKAKRVYDAAVARAMVDLEGPAYLKKSMAELATQAEREARDNADAAYRYADRQAEALQDELRALQSVNKSVRAMYGAVGVTER